MQKWRFYIFILLLLIIGCGSIFYKVNRLGFPITPNEKENVLTVEARVKFKGTGQPVKASLYIPHWDKDLKALEENFIDDEFGFSIQEANNGRKAVWTKDKVEGEQTLYFRSRIFRDHKGTRNELTNQAELPAPKLPDNVFWDKFSRPIINTFIKKCKVKSAGNLSFANQVFTGLEDPDNRIKNLLFGLELNDAEKLRLVHKIFNTAKVPNRLASGFYLDFERRNQPIVYLIQILDNDKWYTFDLKKGQISLPENFLFWQTGCATLLELEGGVNSRVSFSTIIDTSLSKKLAKIRFENNAEELFTFSFYSLPVESQNAFRVMLLIPIAALIVAICRVLIGLPTSGTFMPILIALAFRNTDIVTGLVLFLIVIIAGLSLRSYLSDMNLLLVPRISAVVVLVIIIMAAVSIISVNIGFISGIAVTSFPLIIMAWTIERMSIIWEEEGAKNASIQLSGSLFVAVIIYLAFGNSWIQHITFVFPEFSLIVLGLLLLLGNYNGYRISELIRFASFKMEIEDKK